MSLSSHPTGSDAHTSVGASVFTALAGFGSWFASKARTGMRTMQSARMMSTLSHLSDRQLDQIGITRADIPHYADQLMAKTPAPTPKGATET